MSRFKAERPAQPQLSPGMDTDAMWLTQAHFGTVGAPLPAPAADLDPDDELLAVTPPDVVMFLGFDPLHEDHGP